MRSKTASVVPTAGRRPAAGVLLIFTGFLLFAFFGFGDNAHAAIVYDSGGVGTGEQDFGDVVTDEGLALGFTFPDDFSALDIDILLDRVGSPPFDVTMELWDDVSGTPDALVADWSTDTVDSSTISTDHTLNERTNFQISGSLQTAGDYWIIWRMDDYDAYGDVSNQIEIRISGQLLGNGNRQFIEPDSFGGVNGNDFKATIDATGVTPDEIIDPADTAILTSSPFAASGTCDSGTHLFMRVEILDPNTDQVMETRLAQCTMDAWSVPDMGATLWNDTGWVLNLHATDNFSKVQPPADTITFDLNDTGNTNPPPPTVDTQCDVDNAVLEGLCNILIWLFVPSQAALAGIVDLWDEVRLKPPLGYFSAVYDALNSLDQGTSSLELEGTSALSVWFDPIRDALTGFFWLLGGVYAIRRISHLDL